MCSKDETHRVIDSDHGCLSNRRNEDTIYSDQIKTDSNMLKSKTSTTFVTTSPLEGYETESFKSVFFEREFLKAT